MSEKEVAKVAEPSTSKEDCRTDLQEKQKLVPKLHLKLPKVNIVLTRCDKERSPEKTDACTKPT